MLDPLSASLEGSDPLSQMSIASSSLPTTGRKSSFKVHINVNIVRNTYTIAIVRCYFCKFGKLKTTMNLNKLSSIVYFFHMKIVSRGDNYWISSTLLILLSNVLCWMYIKVFSTEELDLWYCLHNVDNGLISKFIFYAIVLVCITVQIQSNFCNMFSLQLLIFMEHCFELFCILIHFTLDGPIFFISIWI